MLWRSFRGKIPINDSLLILELSHPLVFAVSTGRERIPYSIFSPQENLKKQFWAVLLLLQACYKISSPCRTWSSNGGLLGQEMQPTIFYFKPHLYTFVGTYGKTCLHPSMEAIKPTSARSNIQYTRTTTTCLIMASLKLNSKQNG